MPTLTAKLWELSGVTGLTFGLYAWADLSTKLNTASSDALTEGADADFTGSYSESLTGWHEFRVLNGSAVVWSDNVLLNGSAVRVDSVRQVAALVTAGTFTPPALTGVSGQVSYADNYLYWDNTNSATVNLYGIWDSESETYGSAEYESVVVRRVRQVTEVPQLSGIQLRNDQAFWLVPAALIGGNALKDGDTITVGMDVWVVTGDAPLTTVGSSASHYVAICNLERG